MKNLYAYLLDLLETEKQVALGTIVEARGSTPQVPGASAVFSSAGLLVGTLGGGILEGDAQQRALKALKEGKSVLYDFNLEADITSEEGAICGGVVKVLIDALPEAHKEAFQGMKQSLLERQPGLLTTRIGESEEGDLSIIRSWVKQEQMDSPDSESPLSSYRENIERAFSDGKPALSTLKEAVGGFLFLEPFFPLPQLIIAGAGHIGRAVARMGNLLDFEVTVIDDRPEFANEDNIPDADHIIVDNIEQAMKNLAFDHDSFIVIVTRGHRNDAEALRPCIGSDAGYIGMIGSAKKISLMRKKFLEEGWATNPEQFDRVHAPIGIDIGSKTVEEIAVSIAAQLVEVRGQMKNKGKGK